MVQNREIDEKGLKYPGSFDDDGNVTPETLHKYLYHKVANEAEQVPKIKYDMASNIVLAHYPYLAKNRPDVNSIDIEGGEQIQQPQEGQVPQRDYSILKLEKASELLEEGNYDSAIKIFETILRATPEHVDALNGKGMALFKQKKYKKAEECFKDVLRIKPRNLRQPTISK